MVFLERWPLRKVPLYVYWVQHLIDSMQCSVSAFKSHRNFAQMSNPAYYSVL